MNRTRGFAARLSLVFILLVTFQILGLLTGCGGKNGSSGAGTTSGGTTGTGTGGGGTSQPPPPSSSANQWTWVGGSDTTPYGSAGSPGVYGTESVASTANIPGARTWSVGWTDGSGNLWLFGGRGNDSKGIVGTLNDLWKYDPANQTWTWVSGANVLNQQTLGPSGVYGTQGVPSSTNVPGGRVAPVSWADANGNLWLFGGEGVDSNNVDGELNDLWEFSPSSGTWTWISGSDALNGSPGESIGSGPAGVYGTMGVPSATNTPGGRTNAMSWTDSSGNFWLFGGSGNGASGPPGELNDLWKFNPTEKTWEWVSGSMQIAQPGNYGTQNLPSATNAPGGRDSATNWVDGAGNLWMLGGYGKDASGVLGMLDDLWEFQTATSTWVWVGGSNSAGQDGSGTSGVYGTEGVSAHTNFPGSRLDGYAWTDSNGNLWLFGGAGVDSAPPTGGPLQLNDLWEFNPSTKMWTWVGGSKTGNMAGVYGTLDSASTKSMPGGRSAGVSWRDGFGNFWMFGGNGFNSEPVITNYQNDLWRYQP